MRSVKAAAVQLSPVLYSREGTVEKIVRTIHELGRQRAVCDVSRDGDPVLPLLLVRPISTAKHRRT